MIYETLRYEISDGILTITLHRPDVLNALNDTMLAELGAALEEAGRDGAVRALILTGAGRGFCAGQDLQAVREQFSFAQHLRAKYNPLITRMRMLEKPILGAINGVAAGAGASLALACDLRILSEEASLLEAFINVGLIPDSGSTYFLPRLVGYAKAFEWAVTAHRITPQEAERLGIANLVVPPDQLLPTARQWAARLAQAPSLAIALTKRALVRSLGNDLGGQLEYEAMLQEIAGRSEDHREGVQAFLEKRKPQFKGR